MATDNKLSLPDPDQQIRIVVDSNSLNSDELRAFLNASDRHFAVLTDFAWMEAYKSNSVSVLKKSLAVLGTHPSQVIHLFGTREISSLDYRQAGIAKRMARRDAEKDFKATVANINRLPDDGTLDLASWTSHVEAAKAYIDGVLLNEMEETRDSFPEIQEIFTADEVSALRKNHPIDVSIAGKIFDLASLTGGIIAKRHPHGVRGPSLKSKIDTFIFRYALASSLYLVEWIRQGSHVGKAVSKIRNDLIDLNFATYATYFNGVLSKDKNVQRFHHEMRVVLKILRARMPPEAILVEGQVMLYDARPTIS